MQLLMKLLLSNVVLIGAIMLSRKYPSAAGLIGVMPLTGALVLIWVHIEHHGDAETMQAFARGALWGIVPSILFFGMALLCVRKQLSLPVVLACSFGVWMLAAMVHQWVLRVGR